MMEITQSPISNQDKAGFDTHDDGDDDDDDDDGDDDDDEDDPAHCVGIKVH